MTPSVECERCHEQVELRDGPDDSVFDEAHEYIVCYHCGHLQRAPEPEQD